MYRYLFALFFLSISVVAEEAKEAAIDLVKPAALEGLKAAIQPRAEAAEWLYVSYSFDGAKRSSAGAAKEAVIGVKELDGVTCYLIELTVDWRSFLDRMSGVKLSADAYSYFWEYSNEKGSYNYSVDSPELNELSALEDFSLTLPFPIDVGTSYLADGMRYTVIDVDAFVKVGAGKFKCVVYEYFDPELTTSGDASRERFYMAAGVGLVRWEMDYKVGQSWELAFRDDLIKYQLPV